MTFNEVGPVTPLSLVVVTGLSSCLTKVHSNREFHLTRVEPIRFFFVLAVEERMAGHTEWG